MFQHLASELDTLSPEIMRANFGDDEAYVRETQELVDEYLKKSDPLIFAPLAVYSAPRGYIFPEMPWILKRVIVPVLSLRHYGERLRAICGHRKTAIDEGVRSQEYGSTVGNLGNGKNNHLAARPLYKQTCVIMPCKVGQIHRREDRTHHIAAQPTVALG